MKPGHGAHREFWLSNFAIRHRTSVLFGMIVVLLMGAWTYMTLPKEAAPEIEIPFLVVNTVYPGVAPEDIETLITRHIEEELNTLKDVKEITSTSVEGYSSISVEFNTGVNIDDALQKVRDKVDLAKPDLPTEAEEPQIFEFNFAEFPIMQVNVSGRYDLVRLKKLAEDLKDEIEQIPEVLEVSLSGGLEREVQVQVELAKLKYYGLSFPDVIDAISFENVTFPGGNIEVGDIKFLVRIPGEFDRTEPINDVVITTLNGRPVYVRDVANVEFGFKDRDSYARLNHNSVVTLSVIKRSGENIIETAAAVNAVIDEMRPDFPPTTEIHTTADMSDDVQEMVSSLENNIISGLLLVLAVLMFFLGVRNAGFVAISIPLSMFLSFLVMQALGMTINFVILFSLILALGMLVDNAVVVVENIYRHMEQGYSNFDAARKATGEVAMPIIASTFTTLAAFTPLLFWPGIVGEFMGYLPRTLIITLSSSLFVALTIIPTLCALFLRVEKREKRQPMRRAARWTLIVGVALFLMIVASVNPLTAGLFMITALVAVLVHYLVLRHAAAWVVGHFLPIAIRFYERRLRWTLRHRALTMAGTVALLILSIMAYGRFGKGVVFFPDDVPPAMAYVQVETPVGTVTEVTDAIVQQIEGRIDDVSGREDVETIVATTGSRITNDFGQNNGTHLATVTVNFIDYQDRGYDAFDVIEEMRNSMSTGIAGAKINVEKPQDGPPTGAPVNIEIAGEDPDVLQRISDDLMTVLENSPVYAKLDGLKSNLDAARPELVIDVDRERAALYNLTTTDIGSTIRSAINGFEASKFRDGEDEYDIVVRLSEEDRSDLNALADLTVVDEMGRQIPLSSMATWRVGSSYAGINRLDLERVVQVSADVRAGYNAAATLANVQTTLEEFVAALPPGYNVRYTGESEEQAEASEFLTRAFVTALILIFFILISQFNSVTRPFIILTSVLLSTVGVLLGLIVFQMPFGVIMTGIGVISLAGIVVNNSIVLIDYIQLLRERDGLGRFESLVQGGKTRFRPVILTAVTTVLGLVPLAVGLNFDFIGLYGSLSPELYWGGEQAAWWGPMAIAVIVGLSFATFLTLILVPVMISIQDGVGDFFRRHYTRAAMEPVAHVDAEPDADDVRLGEADPRAADPEPAGASKLGWLRLLGRREV
jgi:multidrug efflux pump subunit AcrB